MVNREELEVAVRHPEKSDEVARGCDQDVARMPPCMVRCSGHVTGESTECLPFGMGTPQDPLEKLNEVAGDRKVWFSFLLNSLPLRPGPR